MVIISHLTEKTTAKSLSRLFTRCAPSGILARFKSVSYTIDKPLMAARLIKQREGVRMATKRTPKNKNDKPLKKFLKSGGREGVRQNFDFILKKAVGAKK